MKSLSTLLLISSIVLTSGCSSYLRSHYADRSKIEDDNTVTNYKQAGTSTSSTNANVANHNSQSIIVDHIDGAPLITEKNIVESPIVDNNGFVAQPLADIAVNEEKIEPISSQINQDIVQPIQNIETKKTDIVSTNVVEQVTTNKNETVGSTSALERSVISLSSDMIRNSFSYIPNKSTLYVEVIACDAPLEYSTDKLTNSVEGVYKSSNKFNMASSSSVKSLRSKLEYRDVANGDWSSLANLARNEKYDYVFYGAIGQEGKQIYLTYYLIKVDNGEIIWESTKKVAK